jgi:hypothetical protein
MLEETNASLCGAVLREVRELRAVVDVELAALRAELAAMRAEAGEIAGVMALREDLASVRHFLGALFLEPPACDDAASESDASEREAAVGQRACAAAQDTRA